MGKKIYLYVEGETEKAFLPFLRTYLKRYLGGVMPSIKSRKWDGPVPRPEKFKAMVHDQLSEPEAYFIALTDVYPQFDDAGDARSKLLSWAGGDYEKRFHAHAACRDFEAWLLPYWSKAQVLAKHNRTPPSGNPETVNHDKPPSKHFKELFGTSSNRRSYNKVLHCPKILEGQDLGIAVKACPELKSLINTILKICGKEELP